MQLARNPVMEVGFKLVSHRGIRDVARLLDTRHLLEFENAPKYQRYAELAPPNGEVLWT